jgi:hypothetical protein
VDGHRLGRISLTADAAYCALAALCVLVFAQPLAHALSVPVGSLAVAAAATAGWAAVLRLVARRDALRPWLVRVLVANLVAAAAIIGLAISRPRDGVSLLLLAVALEVAAFAVSQALALRRLAHP